MTDKAKLNYLKNKHDRSLEPSEFSSTCVCSVSISPCQMDGFLQSALPSKELHLQNIYTPFPGVTAWLLLMICLSFMDEGRGKWFSVSGAGHTHTFTPHPSSAGCSQEDSKDNSPCALGSQLELQRE